MKIFEMMVLMLIAAAVVVCARKSHKRIVFKSCTVVLVMLIAKYLGNVLGDLMLPDLIKDTRGVLGEELSEKINDTLVSALGSLILFIIFFIILKQMFRIIEGKMSKTLYEVITARIHGTLEGIFVCHIENFIQMIFDTYSVCQTHIQRNYKHTKCFENNLLIFKFSRILN